MPKDMKLAISEAFLEMIRHGNVDKITVKSLIEECHVSRQTFYYHFQDILDVMEWSIQRETERLVEKSLKVGDIHSALLIFISFTVEGYQVLQKLLQSQRRREVEKFLIDSIETYLTAMAKLGDQNCAVNIADGKVLLRYNAGGLVGVLLEYAGKPDLDKERLASQLERILSGELLEWKQP